MDLDELKKLLAVREKEVEEKEVEEKEVEEKEVEEKEVEEKEVEEKEVEEKEVEEKEVEEKEVEEKDDDEEDIIVDGIEYQLNCEDNIVLDPEDMEIMGTWNGVEIEFENDELREKHQSRIE